MIHVFLVHVRPACSCRLGSCDVFQASRVVVSGAVQRVFFYAARPYCSSRAYGRNGCSSRGSRPRIGFSCGGVCHGSSQGKTPRYIRGISVFVLHRFCRVVYTTAVQIVTQNDGSLIRCVFTPGRWLVESFCCKLKYCKLVSTRRVRLMLKVKCRTIRVVSTPVIVCQRVDT